MNAKLDYKSLVILAKEISKCSAEHTLILSDLENVRRLIRNVKSFSQWDTKKEFKQAHSMYSLRKLRTDLLRRERQLLEHRAALVDQLRW